MKEEISVDKAIWKGHKMITIPVMIIIVTIIGLGMYLTTKGFIPAVNKVVVLAAAIILGWLYWSFMITRWRIWAFERVKNIDELKRQAVEGNLIWKDGSVFEKTEIRSATQKETLKRFDQRKTTNR